MGGSEHNMANSQNLTLDHTIVGVVFRKCPSPCTLYAKDNFFDVKTFSHLPMMHIQIHMTKNA
jgi:hypothetical protein